MDTRVEEINKQEVLKYLSYRGSDLPEDIDRMIDDSINRIKEVSRPKYTYKIFDIERDEARLMLKGSSVELIGRDIADMLSTSDKCIVFAATLGIAVDQYIRMSQIRDFAKSIVLDSCASSAIESVCNAINRDFEERYSVEKLYLTDRFSPGYGDMPIGMQLDIANILDMRRSIGVNITSSGIMIPRKSVTAIIGISEQKQRKRFSGCENCSMFMKCEYRKNGKSCGREE